MGVMGAAFGAAGKTVGGGFVSAVKSSVAANHAADMLDEKPVGLINKTVDFAVDTVGDVANVATLGVSRRITNVFASESKKLDYKGMKAEMKEAKADGKTLTVKERAAALADVDVPEGEEQSADGPSV